MLLQRFRSTAPASLVCDELDRLLNTTFGDLGHTVQFGPFAQSAFPATNVWEDEKNVFVEADVPGFKVGDIDVSVQDNMLTISAEQKTEDDAPSSYLRRERFERRFSRSINLPIAVDAARVEAALRNGVLTVTLPKSADLLPKRIEVTE